MFLQQLFNGLSVGSIYALMAVGYSLIYSLLNFTNFAHSLTVTLGAFVAFFVTSTALQNLTVGILAAVAVAGAAAMLIQKTAYSPLLKKNVRRIYLTIAGLGTVTIGENLMIIGFTGRFRAYPVNFSSDMISIFGASVGEVDLIIFLLSVVALVAVEINISQLKFLYPLKTLAFPAFSPPRFGPFPSFFPLREEMRETFFRPSLQPYPEALRKFAWPLWWHGRKCSSWYLHQNVPAAPVHPWVLPREREGWSYMYASTDGNENHPYPRSFFGSIGIRC